MRIMDIQSSLIVILVFLALISATTSTDLADAVREQARHGRGYRKRSNSNRGRQRRPREESRRLIARGDQTAGKNNLVRKNYKRGEMEAGIARQSSSSRGGGVENGGYFRRERRSWRRGGKQFQDRRQEQRPGRRHRVATGERLFDYDRGSLSEEIERERPHFQGEYSRYSREKFQKSIQKDFHLSQLREILKKEMERKKRLDEQTTDPDDPYCENKYLSDEEDGSDNPAAYTGVLDELEHQKVQQLLGEEEEVGGGLSNRQLQYQATSLPLKKPREIEKLLPFICKECDAEFAEARKLGQHMEIMHDLKVNYADLMPNMDLINSSLIEDIDAQMMEPMEGFTTKRLLEEDRGERSKKRIMPAEVSDGVPKMQRELLREDRMKKSRSRRNAR